MDTNWPQGFWQWTLIGLRGSDGGHWLAPGVLTVDSCRSEWLVKQTLPWSSHGVYVADCVEQDSAPVLCTIWATVQHHPYPWFGNRLVSLSLQPVAMCTRGIQTGNGSPPCISQRWKWVSSYKKQCSVTMLSFGYNRWIVAAVFHHWSACISLGWNLVSINSSSSSPHLFWV